MGDVVHDCRRLLRREDAPKDLDFRVVKPLCILITTLAIRKEIAPPIVEHLGDCALFRLGRLEFSRHQLVQSPGKPLLNGRHRPLERPGVTLVLQVSAFELPAAYLPIFPWGPIIEHVQDTLYILGDRVLEREPKKSAVQDDVYHGFDVVVDGVSLYNGVVLCQVMLGNGGRHELPCCLHIHC